MSYPYIHTPPFWAVLVTPFPCLNHLKAPLLQPILSNLHILVTIRWRFISLSSPFLGLPFTFSLFCFVFGNTDNTPLASFSLVTSSLLCSIFIFIRVGHVKLLYQSLLIDINKKKVFQINYIWVPLPLANRCLFLGQKCMLPWFFFLVKACFLDEKVEIPQHWAQTRKTGPDYKFKVCNFFGLNLYNNNSVK